MIFFLFLIYAAAIGAGEYRSGAKIPRALTTDGGCRKAQDDNEMLVVTSRLERDPYFGYQVTKYWCRYLYKTPGRSEFGFGLMEFGPYILHCPISYILIILEDVPMRRVRRFMTDTSDRAYCVPSNDLRTYNLSEGMSTQQCLVLQSKFDDELILAWVTMNDGPNGELIESSRSITVSRIWMRGPFNSTTHTFEHYFNFPETSSAVQRLPKLSQNTKWEICMRNIRTDNPKRPFPHRLRATQVDLSTEEFY